MAWAITGNNNENVSWLFIYYFNKTALGRAHTMHTSSMLLSTSGSSPKHAKANGLVIGPWQTVQKKTDLIMNTNHYVYA